MKNTTYLKLAAIAFCSASLATVSCKEKGPAEKAGEKVDEAIEEVEDEIDDATTN